MTENLKEALKKDHEEMENEALELQQKTSVSLVEMAERIAKFAKELSEGDIGCDPVDAFDKYVDLDRLRLIRDNFLYGLTIFDCSQKILHFLGFCEDSDNRTADELRDIADKMDAVSEGCDHPRIELERIERVTHSFLAAQGGYIADETHTDKILEVVKKTCAVCGKVLTGEEYGV